MIAPTRMEIAYSVPANWKTRVVEASIELEELGDPFVREQSLVPMPMYNHFMLKIAGPMMLTSFMLLAMGVIAAWNVQRQQIASSDLIEREVQAMIAAQDLSNDVREIRNLLHLMVHDHESGHTTEITQRLENARSHLADAKKLIRTPPEREAVLAVEEGLEKFSRRYESFASGSSHELDDVQRLASESLKEINLVLAPTKAFLTLDHMIVDKTNESNRQTTESIRQTFLMVGICGGLSGLVVGLVIARGIRQSVVQLDVSIRGAAGRLEDVVGPIKIIRSGDFRELEVALQQIENHVKTVVERLRQRELEVLHSDQLAGLGQLAAGVAHELRNPLMPMKMLVQAAVERDDGVGLCGRQLLVVEEEIRRMEASIQDFLEFARPTTLEIHEFDLRTAIEQIVELLSARAELQRVELVEVVPHQPVLIEADGAQIRQVLLNLMLNAFDALPHGGKIQIRVARESAVDHERSEAFARFDHWVSIRVTDTGAGLTSDVLARAFEPFVSTKETGTGLGLSICRRIVEAHDGVITAGNSPEGGAMFTVYLPLPSQVAMEPGRVTLLSKG